MFMSRPGVCVCGLCAGWLACRVFFRGAWGISAAVFKPTQTGRGHNISVHTPVLSPSSTPGQLQGTNVHGTQGLLLLMDILVKKKKG